MAEALLSAVLDQLVSLAQQYIHDQVCLVVGVTEEIKSLASTLRTVQAVVADAEKRQVKEELVRLWLKRLKEIAYKMDEVLDEWATALLQSRIERGESSCKRTVSSCLRFPCICFKRVSWRRDIALKIKAIKQQIDDIANEQNQFNFTLISPQEPKRLKTVSALDVSIVFGRVNDMDCILNHLLDQNSEQNLGLRTISIVGMGGMGKTTLAQLVFNNDTVKTHFEKRIWVCVSDPFVPERILKAILEALGQSSDLHEPEALRERIQTVVGGKNFLLALDDVWNEDNGLWELLKNCLNCGGAKSRILATTRNENVATTMGSTYVHHLGGLPKEQCWELFRQIAFYKKSKEKIEELQKVGERIIGKCKGLPLAIKALASLLQTKDKREDWADVLNSETWELDVFKYKLSPALLLSYYDLSPALKQCFSFCAVFPKDYKIKIKKLIDLWMAQGYLDYKVDGEIERLGREYFENLAARSFFQDFEMDNDGNIISCKMHDIVHDFAQFLTQDECLTLDVDSENWETNLALQKCRHATLNLHDIHTIPFHIQNVSNLHTVLIKGIMLSSKFLTESHKKFKYLRALEMEGNDFIIELPEEIGTLVYLRYLGLSMCYNLQKLPESICCLCNLQKLDVYSTRIDRLPQGIGKLVNLRHLLNGKTSLRDLPKGVATLNSLRTLSTFIVSRKSKRNGCKIEDLGNLKELRGKLEITGLEEVEDAGDARKAELHKKQLHRLSLEYYREIRRERVEEQHKEVVEALKPHSNLKFLQLRGYGASEWPRWMMDSSLHQLRTLILSGCCYCERLPPLGELPLLESLYILGVELTKYVGTEFLGSLAIKFPKLKRLHFKEMTKWENWELKGGREEEEEGQVMMMPCLLSLRLDQCERLKDIPKILLRRQPALRLEVHSCDVLEAWLREKGFKYYGSRIW